MKKLQYIWILGLLASLSFSFNGCATYKAKQQAAAVSFPELASLVQVKDHMLYTSANPMGVPQWSSPLKVQLAQLPFNKAVYSKYASFIQQSAGINSIVYIDSLPVKPKYLKITLTDHISLTKQLNASKNDNVCSYLENNADYKLVTSLFFTVPDAQIPQLLDAEFITLEQDAYKEMKLVLHMGKQKKQMDMKSMEVFDYEYHSFCWGEDQFHNKKIQLLTQGNGKCPKGTEKKATKLKRDQSYLKL